METKYKVEIDLEDNDFTIIHFCEVESYDTLEEALEHAKNILCAEDVFATEELAELLDRIALAELVVSKVAWDDSGNLSETIEYIATLPVLKSDIC